MRVFARTGFLAHRPHPKRPTHAWCHRNIKLVERRPETQPVLYVECHECALRAYAAAGLYVQRGTR